MERSGILLSVPVAFVIFVILLACFYIFAGRFSSRFKKSKEKVSTYACGEDIPGIKFQFGYQLFFVFALFFTIMHVTALVIATLPSISPVVYFGIFYLAAIFLSVLSMVVYRDNDTGDNTTGEANND